MQENTNLTPIFGSFAKSDEIWGPGIFDYPDIALRPRPVGKAGRRWPLIRSVLKLPPNGAD
jgi:hypothetical protein